MSGSIFVQSRKHNRKPFKGQKAIRVPQSAQIGGEI